MIGKTKVLRINEESNAEWYDEIDPVSFYEKHFETTFLDKINIVYPDFVGIPFSLEISNDLGEKAKKPDLAIIRKDYQEWYVIEAEMGRHSWEDHVEKQVKVFASGIYEKHRVANYIFEKDSSNSLVLDKLIEMVSEIPPKVMVIVNEHKPEWQKEIKKYKAFLSVFQIYKGLTGFEIYRIEGDTPFVYRDSSHCDFVKGSSNMLRVYTPSFILEKDATEIVIVFRGRKTKWIKTTEKKGTVILIFKGSSTFLQLEKKYVLYITNSNEYYLDFN
ncbi:MAG: hypothetical protein QM710_14250 [Flavobacterium sp.]